MAFVHGSPKHYKYLLYQRRRIVRLRSNGLCVSCSQSVEERGKYTRCESCRSKRAQRESELPACRTCGSTVDLLRGYCRACGYGAINVLRFMAMRKLGSKCSCCKEREPLFLNFDHIARDGKWERGDGNIRRLYRMVIAGIRDDIRLLCFNCNLGRELNGGVCPHRRKTSLKRSNRRPRRVA